MVSKRNEGWMIGLILVLSIGLAGAFFAIVGLAHQVSGATQAARSAQHQVDDLRRQLRQAHKLIAALQRQVIELGGKPVTSPTTSDGSQSQPTGSTSQRSPKPKPHPSPSPTQVGPLCQLTSICVEKGILVGALPVR